jgi:hypothetical protein
MDIQSVTGWQDHILAGRQYLKAARNGKTRPAVFNNELVFQLAAMAIEKFIVGVAQYHRLMPNDHTLSGLVAELSGVCSLEADLAGRIKRIETIDDMCALAVDHRRSPRDDVIREILEVGCEVARFVDRQVTRVEGDPASA